jgi:hypothetical protein
MATVTSSVNCPYCVQHTEIVGEGHTSEEAEENLNKKLQAHNAEVHQGGYQAQE